MYVDYSENYKNKQQKKIKSAYYGQCQFTLTPFSTAENIICAKNLSSNIRK